MLFRSEVSKLGRTRLEAAEKAAAVVEDRLFAGIDAEQRAELLGVLAQVADRSGILEGCVDLLARPD